jgi:hypothetical protein
LGIPAKSQSRKEEAKKKQRRSDKEPGRKELDDLIPRRT